MRVGTFCFATSRGLGHLARDFHRHGLVTDPLVVVHGRVPTNHDWYPGAPSVPLQGIGDHRDLLCDFVRGMDAMLFFETPFWWPVIEECRRLGVRTYLITMYECTPQDHPPPDTYLCPSLLDLDYFPDGKWQVELLRGQVDALGHPMRTSTLVRSVLVQLPVDYPWRLCVQAHTYVHNGGYLGLKGSDGHNREGTTTLIEAMQYVRSPLRLILRCQENVPDKWLRMAEADPRIDYRPATVPYEELYAEGEVCVGAQKWNGCSLPLQEAFASGMLVMNTDRFPMNCWLPRAPLIPVSEYRKHRIGGAYLEFDEACVSPQAIAAKMDEFYGRDVSEFSRMGKRWAEANSWEALLPKWREVLAS